MEDYFILSDDKTKLRRAILKGMCRCAEGVNSYYESGPRFTNIHFPDGCPEAFRPGVADKFLFNKIIDIVIDNIHSEDRSLTNEDIVGAAVMGRYYYPVYR